MVSVCPRIIFLLSRSLIISFYRLKANATEEFFVRKSPLYEVVGQLGMWGTIINGIQASALEYKGMRTATWNGANSTHMLGAALNPIANIDISSVGLLCAYTAAMFILYTVAPILYRMASSAYYNLSLLSSDFYGLLFGLFLYVSVVWTLTISCMVTDVFFSITMCTSCTLSRLLLFSRVWSSISGRPHVSA